MLRNSEKTINERLAHQGLPGPEQHSSYVDIVLAYVNLLEERIYVLDLELSAMRDRFGHQMWPKDNMPDMASEPKAMAPIETVRPVPTHPWDELIIDAANPLGVSARQRMLELSEHITSLQTQLNNLRTPTREVERRLADVRAKNTELEEDNRVLRAELAAYIKGPGPAPETPQHPILYEGLREYQSQVRDVVLYHWGIAAYRNTEERALRFLEEAIELVQACHLSRGRAEALIAWVYSRQKGPIEREVGGVMVTLAALCGNLNVDMFVSGAYELDRLKSRPATEMRNRHLAKPDTIRAAY